MLNLRVKDCSIEGSEIQVWFCPHKGLRYDEKITKWVNFQTLRVILVN